MAKSRASGKVVSISEGEYLARKGLASNFSDVGIDTMRIPHGETLRQQQKRLRDQKRQRDEYFAKREQAKAEYANLVSSGKIKAPSKYDSLIRTAKGNADNSSVQAARRALLKRGIDWRTGKKISR